MKWFMVKLGQALEHAGEFDHPLQERSDSLCSIFTHRCLTCVRFAAICAGATDNPQLPRIERWTALRRRANHSRHCVHVLLQVRDETRWVQLFERTTQFQRVVLVILGFGIGHGDEIRERELALVAGGWIPDGEARIAVEAAGDGLVAIEVHEQPFEDVGARQARANASLMLSDRSLLHLTMTTIGAREIQAWRRRRRVRRGGFEFATAFAQVRETGSRWSSFVLIFFSEHAPLYKNTRRPCKANEIDHTMDALEHEARAVLPRVVVRMDGRQGGARPRTAESR